MRGRQEDPQCIAVHACPTFIRSQELSLMLQIVKVASMLLAESDGLLSELLFLVREYICRHEDVQASRQHCEPRAAKAGTLPLSVR